MKRNIITLLISAGLIMSSYAVADGWKSTGYYNLTNTGSIVNTGHNLTASTVVMNGFMNSYRNDYAEVCVYCHTPHGASTVVTAPLWNRTASAATYSLYSATTTLDRPVTQPGLNSLTCLSCHDGTVGMDSIINMPGPGGYNSTQQSATSTNFLNTWSGAGGGGAASHTTMNGCTYCHDANGVGLGLQNFIPFIIGTDLRNDHPVGIAYPTTFNVGVDFHQPTDLDPGKTAYFDTNNNNRPDTKEIRMYDTGNGYEVECASCHDPHGVPSAGAGSLFIPSFLRVSNASSALCLTCHVK